MGWFSDFFDALEDNILNPLVEAAPEVLAKAGLGYGFTSAFFGGEKYIQVPDGDGGMTWLKDTGFDYSGTDTIVAQPEIYSTSAASETALSYQPAYDIDDIIYTPEIAAPGPVIDVPQPNINLWRDFENATVGTPIVPNSALTLPNIGLKDVISAGSAIANASLAANTAQAQIESQRAITSAQVGALNRQANALTNGIPVIGADGRTNYLPAPTYSTLTNPLPSPMGQFGPLLPDQQQSGVITPGDSSSFIGIGAIVAIIIFVLILARK